ncbi:MAG TPA: hypothetical protein VG502_06900 [Flexivirga sp.]|uniref:hypothetical protein n=1 Tax=Flexivirga sp. TaxID=1962927 RepID=UPI002C17B4CB|nr:hypothetical protein [Flexivirga sp.]HWC22012.1 hypothetical protein [Flexivirga sp.]
MSTETIDTRPSGRLKQKWHALTPMQRKLLVAASAIDTAAKTVALVDLSRRPADAVRGPKWLWASALPVVNSVGVLPAAYFLFGRR